MRVLVCLVVVLASAGVAAQPTFEIPPGYTEQPGGDDLVAQARAVKRTASVEAQAYGSPEGDVQLIRVIWSFKLEGSPSRAGLEAFDREVVATSSRGVSKHVSDMRVFEGDQMVAEAFDERANVRVYHRRLYAVDRAGLVHLLWLVCTGPPVPIAACEKAQRTMKLVVAEQVALPEEPRPVEPPAPWSFVLPDGYTEVSGAAEALLKSLHRARGVVYGDGHVYESPGHDVRLIGATWMMYADRAPSWRDLERFDREVAEGRSSKVTRHVSDSRQRDGQNLLGEHVDEIDGARLVLRSLYGVDATHTMHAFAIMCVGPENQLGACTRAQASMRLALPNQVTPASDDPSPRWRLTGPSVALVVLVVGLAVWIYYETTRRSRRRRRGATIAS